MSEIPFDDDVLPPHLQQQLTFALAYVGADPTIYRLNMSLREFLIRALTRVEAAVGPSNLQPMTISFIESWLVVDSMRQPIWRRSSAPPYSLVAHAGGATVVDGEQPVGGVLGGENPFNPPKWI